MQRERLMSLDLYHRDERANIDLSCSFIAFVLNADAPTTTRSCQERPTLKARCGSKGGRLEGRKYKGKTKKNTALPQASETEEEHSRKLLCVLMRVYAKEVWEGKVSGI